MSVTSLSFSVVSLYVSSTAAVAAAPASAAPAPAPAPVKHEDDAPRGRGRENRLVTAMMSALRALGLGESGTPATAAGTGTPATGTEPSGAALDSAVRQFAHELVRALRPGEASGTADGADRTEGRREHHHHRHHHGHQAYAGLAQRLATLAQSFGTAAPAAPGAAPAASDAAATTDAAGPKNTTPLLNAFSSLFGAIAPRAASGDMGSRLRDFLQALAQSLGADAGGGDTGTQPGALVNLSA